MTISSSAQHLPPLMSSASHWKSSSFLKSIVLVLPVFLTPAFAFAQNAGSTDSRVLESQERPALDADLDERLARDWGLQTEELTRYRQLMQGPLGVYSPNLDPLTALGIEARTDEERRRYAELQVQTEARRAEKTLAYQRAYDDAWKRLHPTLQPVVLNDAGDALAATGAPGRLAVFVKDDCPPCEQRVRQLQAAGTTFDVYVVGSRQDDARIRQWAAKVGIEPAKVHAQIITLNHDGGRWLSIGVQGELPAIVREVNGLWQRQ
jgi:integrating conjugative element protein (TIGR03759 family)